MSQPLGLDTIATASFSALAEIDELAKPIEEHLGFGHRYVLPRLAMALSLRIREPPERATGKQGRPIRGENLFGTGRSLAAWVSLFVEYAEEPLRDMADLQNRVRDHWSRGVRLVHEQLAGAGRDTYVAFWEYLADRLPRSEGEGGIGIEGPRPVELTVPTAIALPLGPAGVDVRTGEKPLFKPVARGASPHVAIMGGVGSGKTRTALFVLGELARQTRVPLIAFDFKGDLAGGADGLDRSFGAEVLDPLERPIPLDVLAFDPSAPHARALAAQRLRDSLATLRGGAFGPVQRGLLAEAAERALAAHRPCTLERVRNELIALYEEQGRTPDGAVETLNDLCRFPLFEPRLEPAAFFARPRLVHLRQDMPDLVRTVVVTLITDALDRWLNALPDSPVDGDGNRALRIVAVIDEAHRILGHALPGLGNLVRMSRSKGGMVWLISQSPDDFETEEDDFLAEMGLVLAFATNARPGATGRIFGPRARLEELGPGEAWVRLRGEPARRIRVW